MSPWKFNKMLREIKDLPDHFLTRIARAATRERLNRNLKKLKLLYDQRRFP